MKIGIVWENGVSKWSTQMFEPLMDIPDIDINVFVGERNKYDVSNVILRKHFLFHKDEFISGLLSFPEFFSRLLSSPYKRMYFYYNTLNKRLNDYDIMECSDSGRSQYTLANLKKEKRYKLIVSYAENIPYRQVFDEKTNYIKHTTYEMIDHFIPWCDTIKKALLLEGVPEEKITTVYTGIDLNLFKPEQKDNKILKDLGVDEENFIISYIGKLTSLKGVQSLVYAAKALLQNGYEKFCFLITGRGAQLENLKKIMSEAKVEKNFRFTGFLPYEQISKIYNIADVFVLPSYPTMTCQEQFGMVLVEAMACGTPVISTTSGSIPEVVGDAGILVPPGNFFQLASEIATLMDNRDLALALGQKGRERAETFFDAKKNAVELYNVYKKVLNA